MSRKDKNPDPGTQFIQNTYEQSMSEQRSAWHKILEISDQILIHATQSDWKTVDSLHQQRDQMLDDFFRQTLAQDLVEEVQQGINLIRQKDVDIVQMVKNNRDELAHEMQVLQSMKNRVKEYISTTKE